MEKQHGLDISGEELKEAQQTEEILDGVRNTLVLAETAKERECYGRCIGEEVVGGEMEAMEQLVLPRYYQQLVLEFTHYITSRTLG